MPRTREKTSRARGFGRKKRKFEIKMGINARKRWYMMEDNKTAFETEKTPSKKKKKRNNLSKVAAQLLKMAKEGGTEQNYFFTTAFQRYQVQLETLERLQEEIEGKDLLIEKEYVKGRKNLVANPAISEYNKTSTAANQTAQTLIKIIQTFADGPVMDAGADGEDFEL